jgi:hypothetical protein
MSKGYVRDNILESFVLFMAAGLCQVDVGWLVWQWLHEGHGFHGVFSAGHFHPLRYHPNFFS